MEKIALKIKLTKGSASCIAVILCAIFWILLSALGILNKFDLRVYDLLLGFKKNPDTRNELLILEIDNSSLEEIGTWPWNRNVYADSLIRLKELGVKSVLFDIEFLSPSDAKVDENALNDAIADFDGTLPDFSKILIDNDDKFARALQFFKNSWLTVNMRDLDIAYSESDLDYARKRFLFDVEDKDNLILSDSRKNLVDSLHNSIFDSISKFLEY